MYNYETFNYKGFLFFLFQAFDKIPLSTYELPISLYRGIRNMSAVNMIPPLIDGRGYNFGQITSTSKSKEWALRFLNDQGTLIRVYFNRSDCLIADVSNYSYFKQEECIISPFCDMYVMEVNRASNSYNRVELIQRERDAVSLTRG